VQYDILAVSPRIQLIQARVWRNRRCWRNSVLVCVWFRLRGQTTVKLCLSTAWVWETRMTFIAWFTHVCMINLHQRPSNMLPLMLNATSPHPNLWC